MRVRGSRRGIVIVIVGPAGTWRVRLEVMVSHRGAAVMGQQDSRRFRLVSTGLLDVPYTLASLTTLTVSLDGNPVWADVLAIMDLPKVNTLHLTCYKDETQGYERLARVADALCNEGRTYPSLKHFSFTYEGAEINFSR